MGPLDTPAVCGGPPLLYSSITLIYNGMATIWRKSKLSEEKLRLLSGKVSSSTLNNINLCDQMTSVSYFLHEKCPEKKTKHFNVSAGNVLPTNLFRVSVSFSYD